MALWVHDAGAMGPTCQAPHELVGARHRGRHHQQHAVAVGADDQQGYVLALALMPRLDPLPAFSYAQIARLGSALHVQQGCGYIVTPVGQHVSLHLLLCLMLLWSRVVILLMLGKHLQCCTHLCFCPRFWTRRAVKAVSSGYYFRYSSFKTK